MVQLDFAQEIEAFCLLTSMTSVKMILNTVYFNFWCIMDHDAKEWALGCVNPTSWLPLAPGASSRNLGPALSSNSVHCFVVDLNSLISALCPGLRGGDKLM